MAVYRFRVVFEDNEEIYREIEIKSTQTYEDFHKSIVQSINFDNIHNASFFISDDHWRKGEEIVLHPPADDNRGRNASPAKRQMSKCKMALLIDDPHQKFVYTYDPKVGWTFLIELVKIVLDDAKAAYPICAKSVGDAPKQYKKSTEVPVVLEDEDFDEDEPHADDDAYVAAHNDDEIAELEGEEGEEEVVEAEEEASEDEDEFGFSELDHAEGGDED
ncbi:MAG: hypothetical protein V4608_15340 [Bacteroidota bacterium]